jgi:hypothetical protein
LNNKLNLCTKKVSQNVTQLLQTRRPVGFLSYPLRFSVVVIEIITDVFFLFFSVYLAETLTKSKEFMGSKFGLQAGYPDGDVSGFGKHLHV